jgi:N-methylhydantoinase B
VSKYGLKKFREAVEEIFDAGEKIVRKYLNDIPNGEYFGSGQMDNNGVEEGAVPFDVKVIIKDDSVVLDMSEAPPQQNGPINCPLPSTVSTARVALSMLAGSNEAPNEGFFRPIEVITKKGTLFHPLSPAPCFLYGWPALQAMEVFYKALGSKHPEKVPASSGGCINAVVYWGQKKKELVNLGLMGLLIQLGKVEAYMEMGLRAYTMQSPLRGLPQQKFGKIETHG